MREKSIPYLLERAARRWATFVGKLGAGALGLGCSVAAASLAPVSGAHASTWQTTAPARHLPAVLARVGGQPARPAQLLAARAAPATAAAATKVKPILGVYVGNDAADVWAFESWLGQHVDAVLGYTKGDSWEDPNPGWQIAANLPYLGSTGRRILWSIPMMPDKSEDPAYLREAASGTRNYLYTDWAKQILASRQGDSDPIYVRTAWEVGGEWFHFTAAAKADPAAFRGAFQQFAQSFHAVSGRFKMVWDFAGDRSPVEQWYPGDVATDVISQDVYWSPEYMGNDPTEAFNRAVNSTGTSGFPRGLAWMANFAASHGKPMAISEWGVPGGAGNTLDGATFIGLMKQWIDTHDVLYATYWDSEAAYNGKLRDNDPAATATALRDFYLTNGTTTPPTTTSGLVSGGTYRLLARHSGRALDAGGTGDGAGVQQWDYWAGDNQQWILALQADGAYTVANKRAGKLLDVQDNGGQDGAVIWLWSGNGTDAQRWFITPTDNGYYKLLHKGTTKCLDVSGGPAATGNGAGVGQWEYWGGANQQWQFERLDLASIQRSALASTTPASAAPASAVQLYPNPAKGQVTVRLTALVAGQVRLDVRDGLGRRVAGLTQQLTAGSHDVQLPLGQVTGGVYTVSVQHASGARSTHRLIVTE